MEEILKYTVATDKSVSDILEEQKEAKDYREILKPRESEYKIVGNYIQIGEITWTQGWILDLSVIRFQLEDLLETILPVLKREKVPFKFALNSEIARSICGGQFGYAQLGKLVSIYPLNDEQAKRLSIQLIEITKPFKGPKILTDRHLGSVLYTRYGACNPVIQLTQSGAEEEYIYNPKGELVKDQITIPFIPPIGVNWPFSEITPAKAPKRETVLQDKYKPMAILKEDAKGDVKKVLWLEKFLRIKWCVIKEGKQNMNADYEGRDIRDRLIWQFELHKDLQNSFPIPRVYSLFEENGDTYLVMEYIKGTDLDSILQEVYQGNAWVHFSHDQQLELLNYADQILTIIEQMHVKGYIHRDITPANFLVTKDKRLWMIDLELSYSEHLRKPLPPFRMGTAGFVSPEQQATQTPTTQQDIYALGAMFVAIFTGLLPAKFATRNKETLIEQLNFFIPDKELAHILGNCMDRTPAARPTMSILKKAIDRFKIRAISGANAGKETAVAETIDQEKLKACITKALNGLANPPMIGSDHLWWSKTAQEDGLSYYQSESGSVYTGFYEGLSGVLYLLAQAHLSGFSIDSCMQGYETSWSFIQNHYENKLAGSPAGLYGGTSGVAIALQAGIESELLNEKICLQELRSFLQEENVDGNGIIKGISGRGLALLRATSIVENEFIKPLLQKEVDKLLRLQQKDGSWLALADKKTHSIKATGLGHGIAGIIHFLLAYIRKYPAETGVRQSVIKALDWLRKQAHKKDGVQIWYLNNKTRLTSPDLQDGFAGIALTFIKAYESLGEPIFREQAEGVLRNYPVFWNNRDITQANGLIGIGEVYLEAARVFNSVEWEERANWIANFVIHHYREQQEGACYWLADPMPVSTAGFMTGNSGVIHFLLHCLQPRKINHPLMG